MLLKTASLYPELLKILHEKATEYPFTGYYNDFDEAGTYLCRQCGLALFRAQHKFHSGCGWPSFDQEIPQAVERIPDPDGKRIEIVCARCQAHLGHVFSGEKFTPLSTRHCVNSLSLDFVPCLDIKDTEEAIFAAGCFWGVEYYFKKIPGILNVEVGYSGGHQAHPSYEQICTGLTGHYEVVRVIYDPQKISYEALTKYFFEIHDPTQADGQGPDLGGQYLSVIFVYDQHQAAIAQSLIETLKAKGYSIATKILPVSVFWPAEDYHQDYYERNQKQPYCHRYIERF